MTTYEVTTRCVILRGETGTPTMSGAAIAKVVGRSKTWVSRHLTAWDLAGVALRYAWSESRISDDAVLRIARLPHAAQAAAIRNPTPSRRGARHRPQADAIKRAMTELDRYLSGAPRDALVEPTYAQGALDALRWVAGSMPPRLADILT